MLKILEALCFKNFSYEKFYEICKLNLQDLYSILNYNISKDISMFRISSDIIPFGSHSINNIEWWNLFKEEFYKCGNFIKKHNIRYLCILVNTLY